MYVCDTDLRQLLPVLAIVGEDWAEPFNADDQIQPASVDFRLSHVFWKPRKRFTIDLRRARLLELQPRRYYKKTELGGGETITLRPNELLLGRTLEEFTVPNGYAAELTGRSSFARLGLQVNVTGGFINPGWRGRMPLQLVNFSPNPIRLIPGLPICQVRLVKCTGLAQKPYGHPDLESKYTNDDGGPSYWWRDKRIKRLHSLLSDKSVEERIQRALAEAIGVREPEVIERMERLVSRMPSEELQSADAVLDLFAQKEDRHRSIRRWGINLSRASFTVGITASLWTANKIPPLAWWHFCVWGGSVLLILLSIYALGAEVGDHFGLAELRAHRNKIS